MHSVALHRCACKQAQPSQTGWVHWHVSNPVSSQGKCTAFRFSSAAIPWYQRPPPSSKAHPSCITESCENTAWLLDAASLPSVFPFCSSSHASSQKTTTSTWWKPELQKMNMWNLTCVTYLYAFPEMNLSCLVSHQLICNLSLRYPTYNLAYTHLQL